MIELSGLAIYAEETSIALLSDIDEFQALFHIII
jgi:hypothetical protein